MPTQTGARQTSESRHPGLLIISLLLALCTWPCAQSVMADDAVTQQQTQLYRPSHRPPQQLIDVVMPLYKDQLLISSDGNTILFKASPEISAELQELFATLDHPPQRIILSISTLKSHEAATTKTYSTQRNRQDNIHADGEQHFVVTEGQPLTLLLQQQSQTISVQGLLWREINTIPTQQSYLQINAMITGQQAYIDIKQQWLQAGKLTHYQQRVSGEMDQWLPLATDTTQENQAQHYQTGQRSPLPAAIKVSIQQ